MEGAEAGVGAGDLVDGGDEGVACLEGLGVGGERHCCEGFLGEEGGGSWLKWVKGWENGVYEVDIRRVSPCLFYIRW